MKRFLVSIFFSLLFFSTLAAVSAQETAKPTDTPAETKKEPTDKEKEIASNLTEAKRALEYGIDTTVLSVIGQAISSKDNRLSSEIEKQFASLNPDVQRLAIEYFIKLPDFSPRDHIQTMLQNYNDYQTQVVVSMLRFLKEDKRPVSADFMPLLVELSESAKPEIQSAAIDAIGVCGTVAQVDTLLKLFKKSSTTNPVRVSIIQVFGLLKTPETFKFLKEIVEDKSEDKTIRYGAISSLGRYGQKESLKTISASLLSNDIFERGAAISALEGFEDSQVLTQYRQALRDGYWRNRVNALKVIADKKITSLADAVMYLAEKDPENPVQTQALQTLSALNTPEGWSFMLDQFKSDKTALELRGSLAELLIQNHFLPSKEAIRKVMQAEWAADKSWLLNVICRELVNLKSPDAADLYEKMLDHKDYIIRIGGVRGIKDAKILSLHPKLQELLKTSLPAALKATIEDALK